jgi:thioredoxin 1
MKKLLFLLMFALGTGAAQAQVKFETKSTDAVREMAIKQGKLVFIDLYASWCPPCRMMERQVFSRKDVGEFMDQRFVAAKYDTDKATGRELMKKYGSGAIPLYLVFDTRGELLGRIRRRDLHGQPPHDHRPAEAAQAAALKTSERRPSRRLSAQSRPPAAASAPHERDPEHRLRIKPYLGV